MDSVIYFNGVQVGAHPYGYTGFEVDLPDPKTDGSPNVLAVQVRHKQPSSRWYSGSGIYRHVHLLVQDQVHIKRHGVFVTTPGLDTTYAQGFATVHVATSIANPANQDVGISQTVKDAAGTVVAASQTGADLRIDSPHLWSTDDPYLYTLTTELRVGGNVVDSVTTRFGARWFRIDPNEGLSLNGKWMKVKGVDLHHDMGAIGSAINKDALLRQMRIMKSMGVNAFRTSHNPPSPEMLEVCEELGIVMMVEAFDAWNQQKVQFDYARFFTANHTADIQEMVHGGAQQPGRDHVVDRQRDPGLDVDQRHPDRQRADRRHQGGRHHAAGRDRLRPVPLRARADLRGRPGPHTSSTASASTTTPPSRSTACTPRSRRSSCSSPSPARRPRRAASIRTRTGSTRARTTRPASAASPPTTTTSPRGR